MLKQLLSSHLFFCGLAFFILTSGGSLIYTQHVKRQTAIEIDRTAERIKHENPKTTVADPFAKTPPVADTSQGELFHEEGPWHAETDTTDDLSVTTDGRTNAEKNTFAETQENSAGDDSQDALFQQYQKDYSVWLEKYNQAYADWQQARDAVMKLRREADADWVKSLRNLGDVQLKELHAKIREQIENLHSARKKAIAIWEETPPYPTQ